VLSRQQHENILRKELFQAVLSLWRLPSVKVHASQPYIKVGRQYVLVKYTADISLWVWDGLGWSPKKLNSFAYLAANVASDFARILKFRAF